MWWLASVSSALTTDEAVKTADTAAASGADTATDQSEEVGASGTIDSIVVLPFENLSEDPEQEFFVAGMHDALITELAQISALRVISRTSAMAYKDKRVPVPQIARELNVDGILEASVFRVGDTVRIQAQMTQALPVERHLWAHTFDREMGDVLAMHSEVARAVAREVEIELTPQEEMRLTNTREVSPESYELYLKGMYHPNKLTPEGMEIGLEYLNQAVEKDPEEPLPYAALALGWAIIGHTPSPPPDALEKAEAAALKAMELEENPTGWNAWGLAEIYTALGEKDDAFRWLKTALEQRHSYIPWLNRWPTFKSLRDDPRFQDLARRGNAPL